LFDEPRLDEKRFDSGFNPDDPFDDDEDAWWDENDDDDIDRATRRRDPRM
jgi:hypothetical protein